MNALNYISLILALFCFFLVIFFSFKLKKEISLIDFGRFYQQKVIKSKGKKNLQNIITNCYFMLTIGSKSFSDLRRSKNFFFKMLAIVNQLLFLQFLFIALSQSINDNSSNLVYIFLFSLLYSITDQILKYTKAFKIKITINKVSQYCDSKIVLENKTKINNFISEQISDVNEENEIKRIASKSFLIIQYLTFSSVFYFFNIIFYSLETSILHTYFLYGIIITIFIDYFTLRIFVSLLIIIIKHKNLIKEKIIVKPKQTTVTAASKLKTVAKDDKSQILVQQKQAFSTKESVIKLKAFRDKRSSSMTNDLREKRIIRTLSDPLERKLIKIDDLIKYKQKFQNFYLSNENLLI